MSQFNSSILALLFSWYLLLLPQTAIGQNDKQFEKELLEANQSIYQDAERAVDLSKYIFRNADNADTKIEALVTLVNGYTALNKNGEALRYATKMLGLADSTGNIQHRIWSLGLLGEQYQLSHLNGISREYLDRADALIQASGLSDESIAVSRGNIYAIRGNGYKDEIDCDYAIKNYNLAIDSYKAIPEYSAARNNLALVFIEKGNCLLELNNLLEAEENFNLAMEIAKSNQLEEYIQKATLGLAIVDSRKGNFEKSTKSAEELLQVLDPTLHPKIKNELYFLLSKNYLALGIIEKYKLNNQKYESSTLDIEEIERAQFDQVLQFVENKTDKIKDHISLEKILFFFLLGVILILVFYEIIVWRNQRV